MSETTDTAIYRDRYGMYRSIEGIVEAATRGEELVFPATLARIIIAESRGRLTWRRALGADVWVCRRR